MARKRGADWFLMMEIWRQVLGSPGLGAAEIANSVRTGQGMVNRVKRVGKKAEKGLSLKDIANDERLSQDWVRDVLEARSAVLEEQSQKEGPRPRFLEAHTRELCRAARELATKVRGVPLAWPPPGAKSCIPHIEDQELEECLRAHLQASDAGTVLEELTARCQEFSIKAWDLVNKLRLHHVAAQEADSEGLLPEFIESVYNEVMLRSGGGTGTSETYRIQRFETGWMLYRGAWGVARGPDPGPVDVYVDRHKEAIKDTAAWTEVGELSALAQRINTLAEGARSQLRKLSLKRPFPGRCDACPEAHESGTF